ncbi:hypothetical protein NDU88_003300 [Pleurodeles waltl]|uniref:Uncharacterized protein n=1 Tax=Pleurodeles waltl TaxID=8319 RepID=A0AAV7KY46_PLEWA|nr:hypothetical protein NDU88_003300 [Pleurodeles waltl]
MEKKYAEFRRRERDEVGPKSSEAVKEKMPDPNDRPVRNRENSKSYMEKYVPRKRREDSQSPSTPATFPEEHGFTRSTGRIDQREQKSLLHADKRQKEEY